MGFCVFYLPPPFQIDASLSFKEIETWVERKIDSRFQFLTVPGPFCKGIQGKLWVLKVHIGAQQHKKIALFRDCNEKKIFSIFPKVSFKSSLICHLRLYLSLNLYSRIQKNLSKLIFTEPQLFNIHINEQTREMNKKVAKLIFLQ